MDTLTMMGRMPFKEPCQGLDIGWKGDFCAMSGDRGNWRDSIDGDGLDGTKYTQYISWSLCFGESPVGESEVESRFDAGDQFNT